MTAGAHCRYINDFPQALGITSFSRLALFHPALDLVEIFIAIPRAVWHDRSRRGLQSSPHAGEVGLNEAPTRWSLQFGSVSSTVECQGARPRRGALVFLDAPTASLNESDSAACSIFLPRFPPQGMLPILIHTLHEVPASPTAAPVWRDVARPRRYLDCHAGAIEESHSSARWCDRDLEHPSLPQARANIGEPCFKVDLVGLSSAACDRPVRRMSTSMSSRRDPRRPIPG